MTQGTDPVFVNRRENRGLLRAIGFPRRRIRVLCVDDSRDTTDMLISLIRAQPDLEEVGFLCCADELVEEVVRRNVDIVIMDLTMPGLSPLATIHRLAERVPKCRVVAYSAYIDTTIGEAARSAGASAVVKKDGEVSALLCAIRGELAH